MLFRKRSFAIPALLIGMAVGGAVGAAGMLMTDKNCCRKLKQKASMMMSKASGIIDSIF